MSNDSYLISRCTFLLEIKMNHQNLYDDLASFLFLRETLSISSCVRVRARRYDQSFKERYDQRARKTLRHKWIYVFEKRWRRVRGLKVILRTLRHSVFPRANFFTTKNFLPRERLVGRQRLIRDKFHDINARYVAEGGDSALRVYVVGGG